MPAPRFLLKTDLSRFEPVFLRGEPVQAHYSRLRDVLLQRAPAAASLFAEPVSGAGAVSWYGEGSGEPVPLSSLSPARRSEAEALLSRGLAALSPLLDDPGISLLVRHALVVSESDAILALDDTVVLAGWGMTPRGRTSNEALAEQIRTVLGRYSPALASVDAGFLSGEARVATVQPTAPPLVAAARPAAASATVSTRPAVAPIPPVAAASPRSPWLPPLLAGTALLFLLLGVFLAWWHLTRDLPAEIASAPVVDEERTRLAIRLQRDTNEQLEREVERARVALATPNVCAVEAPLELAPRPERQPVRPEAVPPAVPAQPGGRAEAFTGSLAQLLERATVMVVGAGPQGASHGTGFFISGDTIVTNAHVVEAADPAQIFVMSTAIGRSIWATLVNRTSGPGGGGSQPGNPDFAVLRLAEPVPGAQPLALSRTVEKLTDVVAAGYPASVVGLESGMQSLREGRLGQPPELVLSRGSISTIQALPNGLTIMPHSADISAGNSGGPLVDTCGRVVGINTFVSRATEVADRVKYAQKADNLLTWLAGAGVTPQERDGVCTPTVPGLPPGPPGAGPPAGPGTGPAAGSPAGQAPSPPPASQPR